MTIHAFTELHSNFPAFINLSKQPDGTIKVSVRTRGNDGKDCATITLTELQAEEMADSIYKHNYKNEYEPASAPSIDSAADAKDAARYRFLRDSGVPEGEGNEDEALTVYKGFGESSLLPDEIDAAIDSAMSAIAALQPEGSGHGG